jgi:hypothetical protein
MDGFHRTQVLRILSTVLDFNQQECEKLGLARAGGAADSLAAEFVKFLQNESRPRSPPPSMLDLARAPTPVARNTSSVGQSSKTKTTSTTSTNQINVLDTYVYLVQSEHLQGLCYGF